MRSRVTLGGAAFCVVAAGTLGRMAISGVADLTGRVLAGRYRLLTPIGAGASGRVYVADDVRLRRRGRGEGAPRRPRRRRRVPPPLPRRGAGRGVAAPPERDGGLRLGRRRRAVHGARAAAGREPPGAARHRRAPDARAGRSRRPPGHRGARVRARARARAPRHQAGEPALRRARHPPRRRLRPRPRARGGELDRAGGFRGRHRSLRGARAGVGRAARRPRRPLRAGDRARRVGDRHRPGDVRHRDRHAWPPASTPRCSRRPSWVVSVRSSNARADRIRPSATPMPPRWARRSPTRRVRSRARSRSCSPGSAPMAAASSIPRRSAVSLDAVVRPGRAGGRGGRVPAPVPLHEERRPRSQRLVPLVVAFAVIAALVGGGRRVRQHGGGGTVAVPSVVGFSLDRREDPGRDRRAHGRHRRAQRRRPEGRRDRAAARREDRSPATAPRVRLVVSRGPPPVPIPDVRSLSPEDAQARLEEAGFVVTVDRPNNETVPYNDVIDTDPPIGEKRAARLRDHAAREQRSRARADPRHREQELRRSRASAHRQGLRGARVATTSATPCPSTRSIGTNPAAGTSQARGSSVQITVSKGPELVTVPDLKGNTLEVAQQQLVALGLDVDTVRATSRAASSAARRPPRTSDGEEGHQGHVDLLTSRTYDPASRA